MKQLNETSFPYKLSECLSIETGLFFGQGQYYMVRNGKRIQHMDPEEVEDIVNNPIFPNLNEQ